MEFQSPRPRRHSEPILPMINVVFLLLIFFLMSAEISPPAPLDVTPPEAHSSAAERGDIVLYLAASGEIALGEAGGADIWSRLAETENPAAQSVQIRADGAAAAADLARIMARLRAAGFETLTLATVPK